MAICPCHANVYAMWAGEGQDDRRILGILLHHTQGKDTPGCMCYRVSDKKVLSLPGEVPSS